MNPTWNFLSDHFFNKSTSQGLTYSLLWIQSIRDKLKNYQLLKECPV